MKPRRPRAPARRAGALPAAPPLRFCTRAEWDHIVQSLGFSPQQARIVELMLQGKRDKQIAAAMGLRVPTIRTHLARLFLRTGAADRVELLLRVFADLHAECGEARCPRK